MAGESIVVYGSTVAHSLTGTTSAVADTAFSVPADIDADVTTSYVLADVVLACTFATAPAAGAAVYLYRRDLNIKSTNDAPQPDSAFKSIYVGAFIPDLVGTLQYLNLPAIPLSPDCNFYIENAAGYSINAGWTLDVKPFGFGVAV